MVNKMKKQKSYEKIKIGFILLLMLLASSNLSLFSQTKNVGIGTDNPNASALLDLDVSDVGFTTKLGLLIPRMNEAQKNAIPTPATGLIIYQTDGTVGFYYFDGSSWLRIVSSSTENVSFDKISSGTNTIGNLIIGNNASLTSTGTGYIAANRFIGSGSTSDAVDLATDEVAGTLPLLKGGTNLTSTPANGQLLIGNGTNYTLNTLTPGTGINVNNSAGNIEISANSGAISHNALSNLQLAATGITYGHINDQPQTIAGAKTFSSNITAPTFTSTVPTGTSPFTIASNTLVANLNADLLDGNDASAFASSSHTHTGVYEPVITEGTASQYWRGDKTWVNFPTSLAPSGAASQDLSGTYPGPTVAKIRGSLVSETAPTNNQILKWNGTAWTPSADENTTYTAGTGLTLTGNEFSANNTTALWNANKLQGKNLSTTSPTDEQVLRWNNTANEWQPTTIASGGTVTSVGLTMPTQFTVSNTPITGSGVITVALANQDANTIFAAPDGSSGVPTFRALSASDIPALSADKLTSGTLTVVIGGTGAATLTGMLKGDGTNAFTGVTAGSRHLAFWSDANTIAGNDSLKWAEGTFSITGDLTVSGEIDPKSLTLIPQTTAPTAAEGKIYYNQTDHGLKVYNGTSWVALGSGGGSGTELPAGSENQTLRHNGTDWEASDVLMNNGTKIGIGTNNPDSTLQVVGTAYFTSNTRIGENLLVDGSLSYTPLTANSSPINPAGKTYIKVDLTGTFTLSNGTTVGQVIILQVISTGVSADLYESVNCKITGDWKGNQYDTIQLIWDGDAWVEIGRSLN